MFNRKGFMNITSMLVTGAIIAVIMVVSWKLLTKGRDRARSQVQAEVFIHMQSLINQIYLDQNPNQYPPENVLPDQVSTWAMPTNLQSSGELMDIIRQFCRTWAGNNFWVGNGKFACEYHIGSGVSGQDDGGNGPPHGGGGQPAGDGSNGTSGDGYQVVLTQASTIQYCINPTTVARRIPPAHATGTFTCEDSTFEPISKTSVYGESATMMNVQGMPSCQNEGDSNCLSV